MGKIGSVWLIIFVASLVSCASAAQGATPAAQSASPAAPTPPTPTIGQLVLLPPDPGSSGSKFSNFLELHPSLPASVQRSADEQRLIAECQGTATKAVPPVQKGFSAGPAGAIDTVVGVFLDWAGQSISNGLQSQINKYAQQYQIQSSGFFFFMGDPTVQGEGAILDANGNLSGAIRCFRYSRMRDDGAKSLQDTQDGTNLAVDIVGEVHVDQGGQFFQIRPLRAYFAQSKVPDGDVTLTFELSGASVTISNLASKTSQAFDSAFMSEHFKRQQISSESARYFYNDPKNPGTFLDWSTRPYLPFPSISTNTSGFVLSPGAGGAKLAAPVNFTATIGEVGTAPAWLTDLAGFFKAEGSSLSSGLATGLETQLGLKPSTSQTGSSSKGQ